MGPSAHFGIFGHEKISDHAGNQTPHLPDYSLITVLIAEINLVYFLFVFFSVLPTANSFLPNLSS